MLDYRFKNEPYAHQSAYLHRFWEQKEAALFADMGTGKSFMLINNMCMLYDNGHINAALIIAPKGVYRNWAELELPKHIPDHVTWSVALWNPQPSKVQKVALDRVFDIDDKLHILVMNVEAFSSEKGKKFAERFLLGHTTLMAVDESTTIKSPTAQRTKNIYKLGRLANYRRILTGSPVTKSPLDLYTQCAFLNLDLLGFASYYAFQSRYAVMVRRNMGTRDFNQIVGYRRLEELNEKLQPFAFRVTKEECIDLPPKVYVRREVPLTEEQGKAYEEMKKMALTLLDNGSLTTTTTALTQILRLHQICCGHLRTDDGEVHTLKNNRIDALMECIEETSGKAIIWASYTHDILAIYQALSKAYGGGSAATYYGATDSEERQKIVTKFQDPDSDLRFFIGQPKTGGYGLTLTAASTMIYYSNSYDLEIRLQSEDRAHRIGQTKSVTYIDLISPKTIDEKIVEALRGKIDIATQVLGEDLKKWLI
jgi:SNF2 family DNA or RNA helicase